MSTFPPTPGNVGFPAIVDGIKKSGNAPVFRISTADLTTLGDAEYPNHGDAIQNNNLGRGEGAPLVFQTGQCLNYTLAGGGVLNLSDGDDLRKFLECGLVAVDMLTTGGKSIRLPTVAEMLEAGFKVGDSGTWVIGFDDTSGVGAEDFIIIQESGVLFYGPFAHTSPTGISRKRISCSIKWQLITSWTSSIPGRVTLVIIPSWDSRTG